MSGHARLCRRVLVACHLSVERRLPRHGLGSYFAPQALCERHSAGFATMRRARGRSRPLGCGARRRLRAMARHSGASSRSLRFAWYLEDAARVRTRRPGCGLTGSGVRRRRGGRACNDPGLIVERMWEWLTPVTRWPQHLPLTKTPNFILSTSFIPHPRECHASSHPARPSAQSSREATHAWQ